MNKNNIIVVPNKIKDPELTNTAKILDMLSGYTTGARVVDIDDPSFSVDSVRAAQMMVVVGGDGSILRAARIAAPLGMPILGINLGRLGYIMELEMDELELVAAVFDGGYRIEDRMMLSVEVTREGEEICGRMTALNDAVIRDGTLSRMVEIELFCGDGKVARYRADGLIASTPTGSTAYSLSAGGPVIDPKLDCICVTPVSSHSLRAKPMIFSADSVLEIRDRAQPGGDLYVTVDGYKNVKICESDIVRVTKSELSTKLVRIKKHGFYDTLNNKMSE